MWRTSLFTCKIAMVSNFLVIFIFSKPLWESFSVDVTCTHILCYCSFFSVNGNILLFSKLITFVACSLKEVQNFFIQSWPKYIVTLFSILSKPQIIDIEYVHEIISACFVVEDFSSFHNHLFFLVKDSRST